MDCRFFGDCYWFSRTNKEDDERYNLLTTGAIKGINTLKTDTFRLNTKKFKNKTGIYNLNLMYVKRKYSHKDTQGNDVFTPVRTTLCIDEVSEKVNKYILMLEKACIDAFTPIAIRNNVTDVYKLFQVLNVYFTHTDSTSKPKNFTIEGVTKKQLREEEEARNVGL